MKKLILASALTAALATFAATSDDAGSGEGPINTTDFETAAEFKTGGTYYSLWNFEGTDDGSSIKEYDVEGNLATPTIQSPGEIGTHYLELSTEGGILWRGFDSLVDQKFPPQEVPADTGLYVDTLVQFTPTEDGGTPDPVDGEKLAIWLNVSTPEGANATPVTNLMVKAKSYDVGEGGPEGKVATFTLQPLTGDKKIDAGKWYRLTVKAIGNVLKDSTISVLPAFQVSIDGELWRATEAPYSAALLETLRSMEALTSDMSTALSGNTVLPSIADMGTAASLTAVGFKGSGAIDDLVLTTEEPDFPAPGSIDLVQIGTSKYATLAEAIDAAQDGDVLELLGDIKGTGDMAAPLTIAKNITIKSGDPTAPCTITDQFIVIDGEDNPSAVFENVKFRGMMRIDTKRCSGLALGGCDVLVSSPVPSPNSNGNRSAFIMPGVLGTNRGEMVLTLTNNTFCTRMPADNPNNYSFDTYGNGGNILWGHAKIAAGSQICNNTFGSPDLPLITIWGKLMGFGDNATLDLAGNTVYYSGAKTFWGFDLYFGDASGVGVGDMIIRSQDNTFTKVGTSESATDFFLVDVETAHAYLFDTGSLVDGQPVTVAQLNAGDYKNLLVGCDIVEDANGKFTEGKLTRTMTDAEAAMFLPDGKTTYALTSYAVITDPPVARIADSLYTTLPAAVAAATAGDTIHLLADVGVACTMVDLELDKSLTLIAADGVTPQPTIRNFNFLANAADTAIVVSNLTFAGTCAFRLQRCTSFVMGGCTANITPYRAKKCADGHTLDGNDYAGFPVFIHLGSSNTNEGFDYMTPIAITLTDNTIIPSDGTNGDDSISGLAYSQYNNIIWGNRFVKDGSTIEGNTFYSAEHPSTWCSFALMGAEATGATITFKNNTFYGTTTVYNYQPLDGKALATRTGPMVWMSSGNAFNIDVTENPANPYGVFTIEGSNKARMAIIDDGTSTVNGKAVTFADCVDDSAKGGTLGFIMLNGVADAQGKYTAGDLSHDLGDADKALFLASGYTTQKADDSDTYTIVAEQAGYQVEVNGEMVAVPIDDQWLALIDAVSDGQIDTNSVAAVNGYLESKVGSSNVKVWQVAALGLWPFETSGAQIGGETIYGTDCIKIAAITMNADGTVSVALDEHVRPRVGVGLDITLTLKKATSLAADAEWTPVSSVTATTNQPVTFTGVTPAEGDTKAFYKVVIDFAKSAQ